MPTFNEFLASGDGGANPDQARVILDDLTYYEVTVRNSGDLRDHLEAHPECSRTLTEENFANGLQSWHTMWDLFLKWRSAKNSVPLRSLSGQLRRRSS